MSGTAIAYRAGVFAELSARAVRFPGLTHRVHVPTLYLGLVKRVRRPMCTLRYVLRNLKKLPGGTLRNVYHHTQGGINFFPRTVCTRLVDSLS
eukprot:1039246-Rhodomonas_salina.2